LATATPATARWVLIAAILGSSMVLIDGSVVNVTLPTIQRELSATAAATQWIVEAYALFLAALLLVGGALGDKFGRRRLFIIGTVLFAITSVWCGLAPNVEMLISARAAQGLAGGRSLPPNRTRAELPASPVAAGTNHEPCGIASGTLGLLCLPSATIPSCAATATAAVRDSTSNLPSMWEM
jgi:MFS family permease